MDEKTSCAEQPIHYFAETAFLPTGWANNVLITVDSAGWITQVQSNQKADHAIGLNGPVLPGMLNLHSHAFQRAMAGLTERVTGEGDSFWTWREKMYHFLEKLTPEDQQAIAAQLYVEMLKAGFTTVGEFHYLHHQQDGTPYHDRALTSRHIIQAAMETGIAITHMPVLYAASGLGGQVPTDGQKRFINNDTQLMEMITSLMDAYRDNPQVTMGLALHSLRAVPLSMLQPAAESMRRMNKTAPIHIHIAEQLKEVNDCIAWCGERPVDWLLKQVEVDANWCLVHATHMTERETRALAKTGAVAGLCPTTEANLGDGFFNLPTYLAENGHFGIGSDSHVSVSVIEELRLLEYGQRLLHQKRAITRMPHTASIGASLYRMALAGGAQALGRAAGAIEVGKRADFIVLDPTVPTLLDKKEDFIFDAMLFAGNVNPIRHVIAGGKQVVKDFRHVREEEVAEIFKNTYRGL